MFSRGCSKIITKCKRTSKLLKLHFATCKQFYLSPLCNLESSIYQNEISLNYSSKFSQKIFHLISSCERFQRFELWNKINFIDNVLGASLTLWTAGKFLIACQEHFISRLIDEKRVNTKNLADRNMLQFVHKTQVSISIWNLTYRAKKFTYQVTKERKNFAENATKFFSPFTCKPSAMFCR